MIKPATYGQTVQGSYASLQPTEEGRSTILSGQPILLPNMDHKVSKVQNQNGESSDKLSVKKGMEKENKCYQS